MQSLASSPPSAAATLAFGLSVPSPEPLAAPDHRVVLIVDDHLINRVVLQRQMRVLGYRADTAEHGAQAWQAMQCRRYSMLITDCNMPVLDGYELSRRVRAAESARGLPRIPIIAFSASEQEGDAELCSQAGMDARLEKPTALDALRELLDAWLPVAERLFATNKHPVVPALGLSIEPLNSAVDQPGLDHSVLDTDVLQRLTGGDAVANRRALALFQRVNALDVTSLLQAIAATDSAATIHAAHRIKGASRLVGATSFAAVCTELELAGQSHDPARVSVLLPCFHSELTRLNDYLNHLALKF